MKVMRILCVIWAMLLISHLSFNVQFSDAAENEEDSLQYEQMLEEEAEPSDEVLEQEENEPMLEEEAVLSDDEVLEQDEQIDESESELMQEENSNIE